MSDNEPVVDPFASTSRGYPYPAASDPVAGGAAAIQALAGAINTDVGTQAARIGGADIAKAHYAGTIHVNGAAQANGPSVLVNLPLPSDTYLFMAGCGVTWQNATTPFVELYVNNTKLNQVYIKQKTDGLILAAPVLWGIAPGTAAVLYGYDYSALNQGDWGTDYVEPWIVAWRIGTILVNTRTVGPEAEAKPSPDDALTVAEQEALVAAYLAKYTTVGDGDPTS